MNKIFNKIFSKGKLFLQALQVDRNIGQRKLVGTDKYGNRFYQYYKDDGSEAKRMMEK